MWKHTKIQWKCSNSQLQGFYKGMLMMSWSSRTLTKQNPLAHCTGVGMPDFLLPILCLTGHWMTQLCVGKRTGVSQHIVAKKKPASMNTKEGHLAHNYHRCKMRHHIIIELIHIYVGQFNLSICINRIGKYPHFHLFAHNNLNPWNKWLKIPKLTFFSCPKQLNRWPCHWLTN